ncbi:Peptide chain release factor PrfB1, chloroplastic [Datura stramonium]|uniref:Peptide chain release factor PrfB1, chloroplastic n=1 Tax=Datura stramonium TaxID=4076 RepID=A0ABS8RXE2_DATST|nr:Peptide chain release factor PrfB1, chloroplastic [Datura stramonium]
MEGMVQSSVPQYSKPFHSLARSPIMATSVPIPRLAAMLRRRQRIPQLSFHSFLHFTSSPTGGTVSFATPEVGVSNTETREWAIQDFYTLRKDVQTVLDRVEEIRAAAGLKQLLEDLAALEEAAADSSLWDNRAKAQETLQALTDCKDKLKLLHDFKTQADDAETIIKLTEEMDSIDSALLQEASGIIKELNKALDRFELTQLLSGPYDKEAAVITITAGAGGTDAQDWADMLLRMYVRWGEKQLFKTKVVEKSVGEEAGIKSATIEIEGQYAYGYLSGEKGTHRIVRQSPFNAKGLRQRVRVSVKSQFMMNPHNSIIGTYSSRHVLHHHLDVMKNKIVIPSHCNLDVTEYELGIPYQWWLGGRAVQDWELDQLMELLVDVERYNDVIMKDTMCWRKKGTFTVKNECHRKIGVQNQVVDNRL